MKEIKANESFEKIDDQHLEKISGGRITRFRGVRCDKCDCEGGNPVKNGHLCDKCLSELKKTLSPSDFSKYLE